MTRIHLLVWELLHLIISPKELSRSCIIGDGVSIMKDLQYDL